MRKIILLVTIFVSLGVKSQHMYPIHYEGCNVHQFALEGKEIYAEKSARLLLKEIIKDIDKDVLRKSKGEIILQVLVDTIGKPCLLSAKNNLKGKIKKVNFQEIIKNTKWECPYDDDVKVTACVIIKLVFTKNKIVLQRLGYNSKVGWVELDRFALNK